MVIEFYKKTKKQAKVAAKHFLMQKFWAKLT
jgi:hypothetical protein